MSRPVEGSDAKQKMVEAIGKNQYSKFKENESSLIDFFEIEEIHGLIENIWHLCTFLQSFDLYHCVSCCFSNLFECALKTRSDFDAIT